MVIIGQFGSGGDVAKALTTVKMLKSGYRLFEV